MASQSPALTPTVPNQNHPFATNRANRNGNDGVVSGIRVALIVRHATIGIWSVKSFTNLETEQDRTTIFDCLDHIVD
jgi:hypothetical protein